MLNKIILFVVNQYSVIVQRNCPWLLVTSLHRVQFKLNRPRPRIQRLPATHLKLIERARSNRGNTVSKGQHATLSCTIAKTLKWTYKARKLLLTLYSDDFLSGHCAIGKKGFVNVGMDPENSGASKGLTLVIICLLKFLFHIIQQIITRRKGVK